ncbi:oligosaccharide flippase family protein [Butyrivibrio sp. VCD2006]|uniref:oligosaccharide flippase family protein n=1 Tax=Butyrivibrio sp. VCD2006 TaxID=1280664 RepID=UPI000420BD1E|nr:oligosaccharide flippase family protein [Butyrivibrio sp. VCD2006]
MSKASLKNNYLYRSLYDIYMIIVPLATAPYISRVIGADGIGIYSYSASIMSYFTMIAALGTNSYGIRECARNRDSVEQLSRTFWEIELLSALTTLMASSFWVGLCIIDNNYRPYFWAQFPILLSVGFDISWFFTGVEKIKEIVRRNVVIKTLGCVFLFLLVKDKNDLIIYILINSVAQLLGSISMWVYLPSMLGPVKLSSLKVLKHLKQTLVYFIPTIATSVYTVLDKTLIGVITKDNYANGYYEQSTKIINIAKTVAFSSVNSVMGARMAYLFKEQRHNEIREKIQRSFDFIMFLSLGSSFGIFAISKRFVPVFFGKGYEPAIGLLRLMTPLIVIIGVSNCLGCQYYTPVGKRLESSRYIIIGSGVNLCINLALIPTWGATGAVIGSIIAESVITVLYIWKCDGYLPIKTIFECVYKKILAGIIMAFLIAIVDNIQVVNNIVTLIVESVLGASFYALFLLKIKDSSMIYLYGQFRERLNGVIKK